MLGIDLSLNASGLSVRSNSGQLYSYFFPICKKHVGMAFQVPNCRGTTLSVQALPFIKDHKNHFEKYHVILACIEQIIEKHHVTRILIENYAYKATHRGQTTYGSGEIVRYRLRQLGFVYEDVGIKTLKKRFAGNGNASKLDMFNAYIAHGYPDIRELLKVKINKHGDVPSPLQDIVDSLALVHI